MSEGSFDENVGILMTEWYDEKANDWRSRIHFDYDDRLMRELSMSDLIAVECYSSEGEEKHYGILSIVRKQAWDQTLNSMLKNLDEQNPKEAEEILKQKLGKLRTLFLGKEDNEKRVIVYAKRTPLGLKEDDRGGLRAVRSSQQLRQGADARILKAKELDKIFNAGMEDEPYLAPGRLKGRQRNVPLKLSVERMVTTHSGVFGYTGTGKSNMVSCLVDGLSKSSKNVNVVIFDLEEEYTGLLADRLDMNNDAVLCFADMDSIPRDVKLYMEGEGSVEQAAAGFVKQMLLPRALESERQNYKAVYRRILEAGKVRFYTGRYTIRTIGEFNSWELGEYTQLRGIDGKTSNACDLIVKAKKELDNMDYGLDGLEKLQSVYDGKKGSVGFVKNMMDHDMKIIDRHIKLLRFRVDGKYKIDRNGLVKLLMEKDGRRLIIFQGEHERALQKLSNEIIADERYGVYHKRKHGGITEPLTMFVFDEADKFISSRRVAQSDMDSREAVETVVRRGRKIGLGALIATQRMALLDTNVISQLHTYFISKLPRKDDQQKVVEGFGMGVDMLVETFKFSPGDWLIISNDATGLRNSPIHIHSDDTNDRIKEFFRTDQIIAQEEVVGQHTPNEDPNAGVDDPDIGEGAPGEDAQEEVVGQKIKTVYASNLDREFRLKQIRIEELGNIEKVTERIEEYGDLAARGGRLGQFRMKDKGGLVLVMLIEVLYDHVFVAVDRSIKSGDATSENHDVWVKVARYLASISSKIVEQFEYVPGNEWNNINIDTIGSLKVLSFQEQDRLRGLMEFIQVNNEGVWLDKVGDRLAKGDRYPIPGYALDN